MVQRINPEDIERIRNDPKDYLYIRAPMERDYDVWVRPRLDTSCGLYYMWRGGTKCVYWSNKLGSRAVLQIKHLEWVRPVDTLQINWGFTLA